MIDKKGEGGGEGKRRRSRRKIRMQKFGQAFLVYVNVALYFLIIHNYPTS
jgi:hypothetical protein